MPGLRRAIVPAGRTSFRRFHRRLFPVRSIRIRLTSYEIGLKTDLGRRVSFDIAAYHLDWKDIQLFSVVDSVGVNVNGGRR